MNRREYKNTTWGAQRDLDNRRQQTITTHHAWRAIFRFITPSVFYLPRVLILVKVKLYKVWSNILKNYYHLQYEIYAIYRHGVLAPWCILFSSIFKIYLKKCCVYISMSYVPKKWFWEKNTFYVAYVKMTKLGTKISIFVTLFFCLFCTSQKNIPFYKNVSEHIKCEGIQANIFLLKKLYFKIYFLAKESICTWD
jgi:hypothetical protein